MHVIVIVVVVVVVVVVGHNTRVCLYLDIRKKSGYKSYSNYISKRTVISLRITGCIDDKEGEI
jgi:hypothetical protein